MTTDEFNSFREKFNLECVAALTSKGVEYAGRKDRLNNFKSVSERTGQTPLQVWSIYALKHLDSILSYVREGKVFSESIRSRFMDARNYLDLGLALIEESTAAPKEVRR